MNRDKKSNGLAVTVLLTVASIALCPAVTSAQGTASGGTAASSSYVNPSLSANTVDNPSSSATLESGGATPNSNGMSLGGTPSKPSAKTNEFDLETTIQLTLASSSDLAIAKTNINRDRALVAEATDEYNPILNASGTATHIDSKISIPFGAQEVVVEPENTQTLDAVASLPIDISGKIKAETQAARLQLYADKFNYDRVRNALILNAQTTYFNVLRAQHQVSVAQSSLSDAETQYKTAETQYSGGVGQKIDVYRASTQVSQAQQSLLQAQNAFALEEDNFNDVVGRQLNAPVVAKDVPGVTVGNTVTENGQPNTVGAPDPSVTGFFAPSSTDLNEIDINADIQKANLIRPELRSDLVNIQAAAKQISIDRADNSPSLSLSAVGDYYPVTDFQSPRHSLGILSATLSFPIFDGGVTHDKVRAARDSQLNDETTYSSDLTTVELQVRQAYLNIYTAANQITAANTALEQAIAARQLAQVRYANGVGLYLEVTDAEAALTSAENSQVNSVYDYLIARAQYQNAVGTPDLNPNL